MEKKSILRFRETLKEHILDVQDFIVVWSIPECWKKDRHLKSLKIPMWSDSDKMHYDVLAQGMKHFKETEKGRGQMCEAVENYAKEYAVKEKIISVQNLMANTNFTLEQALNALGIQGDERDFITKQLQKL